MDINRFITEANGSLYLSIPVNRYFNVRGDGLWSDRSELRSVFVTEVSMVCENVTIDEIEAGATQIIDDFRVVFDVDDWDVRRDGLIYTDSAFIEDVRSFMLDAGFPVDVVDDIDYSEQGMQGETYVSCDAWALADFLVAKAAEQLA